MKKLFTTVFLILPVIATLAQNYHCIKSGADYFFAKNNNNVVTISIDSVQFFPGFDRYFNFPAIGETVENNWCLSDDWPSWLGRKIDIYSDGDHYFYNFKNESNLIKALAEPGDSWTCYLFDDGSYVQCSLFEKVQMEFLGITDSVKKISFQGKDAAGNNISLEINTKQLWISKSHGLVKAVNFKLFPDLWDFEDYELFEADLAGISNSSAGIQNLTHEKIFDLDVGDELHIHDIFDLTSYGTDLKEIRTVIAKEWTGNTVNLTFKRCARQIQWEFLTQTIYVYDDTIIEQISPDFYNYYGLDSVSGRYAVWGDGDFEYHWFTQGIHQETGRYLKLVHSGYTSIPDDTCIYMILTKKDLFDPEYYLDGLAGPYWDNTGAWGTGSRKLVYYKKGSEEWGEPYICDSLLTGIQDQEYAAVTATISPNPVADFATVRLSYSFHETVHFRLFDSMSRMVSDQTQNGNTFIFDRSGLRNGLYFYQIVSDNRILTSGKVILK